MDNLADSSQINPDDDFLPPHVIEMIEKGLTDIEAGRTITMEEFVKRLTIFNSSN